MQEKYYIVLQYDLTFGLGEREKQIDKICEGFKQSSDKLKSISDHFIVTKGEETNLKNLNLEISGIEEFSGVEELLEIELEKHPEKTTTIEKNTIYLIKEKQGKIDNSSYSEAKSLERKASTVIAESFNTSSDMFSLSCRLDSIEILSENRFNYLYDYLLKMHRGNKES